MFKLQLYILFVIYVQNSSCVVNTLYAIGKNVWKLYVTVNQINWKKEHNASEVYDLFTHEDLIISSIKSHMVIVNRDLRTVEKSLNSKILRNSFRLLSFDTILSKHIDTVEQCVQTIDRDWEQFYQHMNPYISHSAAELGDLTWNYVIRIDETIEVIRNIISNGYESLLNYQTLVSGIVTEKQYEMMCDNAKTISDTLVQLFQIVTIAEIKANAMLLIANAFRFSHNTGWKMVNTVLREIFEEQFATYTLIFEKYISMTDSMYLRRCDPPDGWLRDVNFVELEGTFSERIFHYDRSTCDTYTCNDMRFRYPDYCSVKDYNTRTGCSGTSARCFWLDSIDSCVTSSGRPIFKYVNSSVSFYGKYSECLDDDHNYRITEWKTERAICACDCYKSHKISIELVESDWYHFKIITGLRFVRQDDILHIQVREGHLTTYGLVYEDSPYEDGWKPVSSRPTYETVDIHTRTFFLDDLRLPADYILTGVNFFKTTRGDVTGFAVEIHGKSFDYEIDSFQFNALPKSVSSMNNIGLGLPFKRISSDQTKLPHKVNPKNITYVTLERSDLTNDFGQTTLPFFDTLPVITTPLSIIGGVGLFHKGVDGFAGFLSFRLYPIVYHKYFIDFNKKKVKNGRALFDHPNDD